MLSIGLIWWGHRAGHDGNGVGHADLVGADLRDAAAQPVDMHPVGDLVDRGGVFELAGEPLPAGDVDHLDVLTGRDDIVARRAGRDVLTARGEEVFVKVRTGTESAANATSSSRSSRT